MAAAVVAAEEAEAAPPGADAIRDGFAELERQQELLASCTRLYQQLTEHFGSLERGIKSRSDSLRARRRVVELRASRRLDALRRRERSIEASVSLALSRLDALAKSPAPKRDREDGDAPPPPSSDDIADGLAALCAAMDPAGFLAFVVERRKEVDALRAQLPAALQRCVDPARFAMDAVSEVFPVDRRAVRSPTDLAWACVLILEAVVPALADPDPEIGAARPMVPQAARDRARAMAAEWKEAAERKGGVEGAKPPDAHAFLQHVATFAVAEKEDRELYKRIVLSFSWRRQMPRLALTLGLEDDMEDIIEELITKGQQLDAVNFAYEAGLLEKFSPVPLLKTYLEDSKKIYCAPDNVNANKKEQSALRAVIKCVEDHKLEAEFPLEDLRKRLEELEMAKTEKKKAASSCSSGGPASKRIKGSAGGAMSPSKAGRLGDNTGAPSSPATATSSSTTTAFIGSPASHVSYGTGSPYSYDRPAGHALYCGQSPPAMREPYAYPPAMPVPNVGLGMPYQAPPMTYPIYAGYNSGLGAYGNAMSPAFHQAYYR
ncbi:FRIGIDA-like protein 4a isoform X2 [Hordeum vulgare subsp. vulgare]|uniref:FRIGIDA-like protein 4a isoform X2 n=1 Tax=Hordeum vulgare subsp. vulgare TaxID=112509 RepID=UPI001D1A5B1F|nr:FRIGIDA-like protein 4a isoform X2 [Hordeum vulgare subsp. vulgare]